MKKYAFLFPGQGAQYPGMGKDFYSNFTLAREIFEEADDILERNLSKIIFEGPKETLTETRNSQVGIFVTSVALMRVLQNEYDYVQPAVCAGLSLGEYTAVVASGRMSFAECLPLVQHRGDFMNDACEHTEGTMAVILGLDAVVVEELIAEANLPRDLWAANFNCPGQVVISGTVKGIEKGAELAKKRGAKRVLPLQVHGAFHSGLMQEAEVRLTPIIQEAELLESTVGLVMNVTGTEETESLRIKQNLISQVTNPVRWEQGVRSIEQSGIEQYIEIGPGKTLAGFNKRIGVAAPTISIEKVEELALCQ